MTLSRDLVAASATPLVLAILASGDTYGYDIIKRVRELSDKTIAWTDGMLYPVLHRLEDNHLVESYWQIADTGRRRKYYRILPPGIEELKRLRLQWESVDATLRRAWIAAGAA